MALLTQPTQVVCLDESLINLEEQILLLDPRVKHDACPQSQRPGE